jgi:hypothetical protein
LDRILCIAIIFDSFTASLNETRAQLEALCSVVVE